MMDSQAALPTSRQSSKSLLIQRLRGQIVAQIGFDDSQVVEAGRQTALSLSPLERETFLIIAPRGLPGLCGVSQIVETCCGAVRCHPTLGDF